MFLYCFRDIWFFSTKNKYFRILSILLLVQIGYGIYPVVVNVGVQLKNMDTFVFLFLRDITTFPLIFLSSLIVDKKKCQWRCKDAVIFFILGFTGVFSGPILFFSGVYITHTTASAIRQPAITTITLLFALLWGMEKFSISKITCIKLLGTLLIVGGAVVAALVGDLHPSGQSWYLILIGYALLIGSSFSISLYLLFLKKWIFNENIIFPPLTTAACAYGMGMTCVSLVFIPYGIIKPETFTSLTVEVIYPLIYATLSNALCFPLVTYVTCHTSPALVTTFWPLQAIFTSASSWIVLGDGPVIQQYIGFGLIIIGTVAVCWGNYREQKNIRILNTFTPVVVSKVTGSLLLGENEEVDDSTNKI